MLHRLVRGVLGRELRGERRRLARALEARAPADDQEITLPDTSVIVTMVLLNVDWMWTMPLWMFFLPFLAFDFGLLVVSAGPAMG